MPPKEKKSKKSERENVEENTWLSVGEIANWIGRPYVEVYKMLPRVMSGTHSVLVKGKGIVYNKAEFRRRAVVLGIDMLS